MKYEIKPMTILSDWGVRPDPLLLTMLVECAKTSEPIDLGNGHIVYISYRGGNEQAIVEYGKRLGREALQDEIKETLGIL